jgi:hypothetical protein
MYLQECALLGRFREIRSELKRAPKVLDGTAEIADLAQDETQAEMPGRRAGIDGEGTAIAFGGGFRRAAKAVRISQTDMSFL